MKKQSAALAVLALTACCVGPPPPKPEPRPTPVQPAPPPPPPAPVVAGADWRDWPITPGDWRYAAGEARFGIAGAAPELVMRCDPARREIVLLRGTGTGAMTIQTSTGATAHQPARPGEVRLTARNPTLDAMAFSRGRFMVTIAGAPRLIAPAWPEVTRVIEDCR